MASEKLKACPYEHAFDLIYKLEVKPSAEFKPNHKLWCLEILEIIAKAMVVEEFTEHQRLLDHDKTDSQPSVTELSQEE